MREPTAVVFNGNNDQKMNTYDISTQPRLLVVGTNPTGRTCKAVRMFVHLNANGADDTKTSGRVAPHDGSARVVRSTCRTVLRNS